MNSPHPLSRRVLFALLLTILIVGPQSSPLAAAADRTDWPQFLGPTRDGVYAGADLAPAWPAGGPKVVWKVPAGRGFAGPVVAGGKVILFQRADDREKVECLDATSGKSIWAGDYPTGYVDDFGFDDGPRATPAVADGRVYTFGAEGMLSAWDLATGKRVWAVDTKGQFAPAKGYFGAACSPLVEGKAVVVNVGGRDGAGVVAFDKDSGDVLWKATNDAASYSSPVAAAIGDRRCVFVFTRAGLVTLDAAGGAVLSQFPWRARIDASVNAATPLVLPDAGGPLVFLSASYGTGAVLLRLDPTDPAAAPRRVWSNDDALSNHYATSVHRDGFLYGFHGRQEGGPSLRCVELKTGKVRWSAEHVGAGTLTLAGDRLLLLTERGELIAALATPDGFKPAGKAQVLGFDTRAYPALADGRLYARGKDKLVCLDLRK